MSKLPELGLPDVGGFIREQRESARISLRQLAQQAGVSNPYLSQVERGLRKPSAEVLAQIAGALRIATPVMYLRAGLLEAAGTSEVVDSIASDSHLSDKQKQMLTDLYHSFRDSSSDAAAAPPELARQMATATPEPTGNSTTKSGTKSGKKSKNDTKPPKNTTKKSGKNSDKK